MMLKTCDISVPFLTKDFIPHISQKKVRHTLKQIKNKPSTIPRDIQVNILKQIANKITMPLTDIIRSFLEKGKWPDVWKVEAVTPIPKVLPTVRIENLRNINGLANQNIVTEKIIAELMLSDKKDKLDKSQYGNQIGVSVQDYLVKFIDRLYNCCISSID